jgi:hypothetical protein
MSSHKFFWLEQRRTSTLRVFLGVADADGEAFAQLICVGAPCADLCHEPLCGACPAVKNGPVL